MGTSRLLAASLGLAVSLLAVCPAAGVAGADAWHPEPAQDIQMKAVFTVVVCLAQAPDACEIRETSVDAVLCFTANRNVAEEQMPEGYTLHSFQCAPQVWRPTTVDRLTAVRELPKG
jgi:hypothetical protein